MQSCKLLLTCMLLFQRLGLFYFGSTSGVFDSMHLSKGGIHGYIGYPPKSATGRSKHNKKYYVQNVESVKSKASMQHSLRERRLLLGLSINVMLIARKLLSGPIM